MGEKALSWVKTENAATLAKLGDPAASPLYDRILSILESKEKIPYVRKIGDLYYNFWQVEAQELMTISRLGLQHPCPREPVEKDQTVSASPLCQVNVYSSLCPFQVY